MIIGLAREETHDGGQRHGGPRGRAARGLEADQIVVQCVDEGRARASDRADQPLGAVDRDRSRPPEPLDDDDVGRAIGIGLERLPGPHDQPIGIPRVAQGPQQTDL